MSLIEIRRLAKTEKRSRIKVRYLAIFHFLEGKSIADIARYLKVARGSVNKWVKNYIDLGVEGLHDTVNPGRPARLTPVQLKSLSEYVKNNGIRSNGGRLQAKDVAAFIIQEFNVEYQNRNRMKRHSAFLKTFLLETIRNIPGHLPLNRVDVWFQDEARFGQQNTTTRIWAPTGSRPSAIKQQQFEYAYLFGAVCPSSGNTEALIAPFSNSEMMREHLALIAQATPSGRHAVVIMDGASWH